MARDGEGACVKCGRLLPRHALTTLNHKRMNVAIVVAAGSGTRLGGNRPKQFLELGGIPIIIHALRQFERCHDINEIVTVLPAEATAGFSSQAKAFGLRKLSRVVAGGETRAQSVRYGLAAISDAEIVAVHDGLRPFVTPEEICRGGL